MKNKGFTLIELIIVVLIISILSIIGYSAYNDNNVNNNINKNETPSEVYRSFDTYLKTLYPEVEQFNKYCTKPDNTLQESVSCSATFILNNESKKEVADCKINGNGCF